MEAERKKYLESIKPGDLVWRELPQEGYDQNYLPAVVKGWKSMVTSVWPDGKVGFIQPIGADPKSVTNDMTEVYGVGGFLMAGTEITRLIDKGIF